MSQKVSKVMGVVTDINDRDSRDFYGLEINNKEWHYGDGSISGISLGDKVKFTVKKDQEHDILKLEKIQGQNSSQSEKVSSNSGGGAAPKSLSKNQQINLKVAHKSAVRQLDRRQTKSEQDYKDMLTKLTKLHLESMQEVERSMKE